MVRRPLGLCRPSTIFKDKIFFSKTVGPVEAKFHMEPQWDGGMKVCSRGLGHMTKVAPTPMYGKNQSAHELVAWYVTLGPWAHHSLFK